MFNTCLYVCASFFQRNGPLLSPSHEAYHLKPMDTQKQSLLALKYDGITKINRQLRKAYYPKEKNISKPKSRRNLEERTFMDLIHSRTLSMNSKFMHLSLPYFAV